MWEFLGSLAVNAPFELPRLWESLGMLALRMPDLCSKAAHARSKEQLRKTVRTPVGVASVADNNTLNPFAARIPKFTPKVPQELPP